MCTNQSCCVKWGTEHADNFNVSNGVKQGEVISPLLISCYVYKLFSLLQNSGLGCRVGSAYAGSFGYADDIALASSSFYALFIYKKRF